MKPRNQWYNWYAWYPVKDPYHGWFWLKKVKRIDYYLNKHSNKPHAKYYTPIKKWLF